MRTLRTKSAQLVGRTEISTLKKELERLAENIQYSNPVSSPAIADAGARLGDAFERLHWNDARLSTLPLRKEMRLAEAIKADE